MATEFIIGQFGSGKSYEALVQIYNELVHTRRPVVTSLAILPAKISALIAKRFPNQDCRVLERLRLLTEEEVSYFFCHRIAQPGLFEYDIPVPSEQEQKQGKRPDFSLWRDCGILFVIDEFHDFFNNRAWAEIGRAVGWYKNQQRKLSDDIIAVTPNIEEVEKQIRQSGAKYSVMTNLRQKNIRGIALPKIFVKTEFCSLASQKRGSGGQRSYITLDKELADCYDTARGVRGIQGKTADINKKVKGIPFWLAVVLFLVGVCLLFVLLFYGQRFVVRRSYNKFKTSVVHPRENVAKSPERDVHLDRSSSVSSEKPGLSPEKQSSSDPDPLTATGYVILSGVPHVFLSDGTTAVSPEVSLVTSQFAVIDGHRVPFRSVRPEYVAQPVQTFDFPSVPPRAHFPSVSVTVIGESHRQSSIPVTSFSSANLNPAH